MFKNMVTLLMACMITCTLVATPIKVTNSSSDEVRVQVTKTRDHKKYGQTTIQRGQTATVDVPAQGGYTFAVDPAHPIPFIQLPIEQGFGPPTDFTITDNFIS